MTVCRLRPRAREDRLAELRHYREVAGAAVALQLASALLAAQETLARQPEIGSPRLGQLLGVPALRTWRIEGFPLSYWYVQRPGHVDVIRLVGHRQDPGGISLTGD